MAVQNASESQVDGHNSGTSPMSLFSPRLSNRQMADLCRRLAIATETGLDIRKTWDREAKNAPLRMKGAFGDISDRIAQGESLHDAIGAHAAYFPQVFVDLVQVGEDAGGLAGVFTRLAEHYDFRIRLRRIFLAAIAWPVIQLFGAIMVVGFAIWIMGQVGDGKTDPFGLGLVGTRGLIIYVLMVGGIFVALGFLLRAVQRGVFWTRGLQNLAMRAPAVGAALRTVAEAQVAWMLHLLLNVELDIRGIIPLALRSTRSDFYTRHTEQIVADVDGGDSLYAAFARSGAFRDDFLRQLEVAEESGRLVESLGPMADRYEQQARLAFQIFTVGGGFSVWALVILILIVMIFRVASFYFGTINDLVDLQ